MSMLLSAPIMSIGQQATAPIDYIARWDTAGDSTDETGNYDITLFNGAVQNSDHIDFDGINDYGQSSRLAFNSNEFTVVSRFRFDTIDTLNGTFIINSRSSVSGSGREWQLIVLGSNVVSAWAWNTSGTGHTANSTTSLSTGVWYVFAMRHTGTDLEIFNETTKEGSVSFSGTMNTGSAHTQFAKRGWDASADPDIHADVDLSRTVAYDYAISDGELALVVDKIKNGW